MFGLLAGRGKPGLPTACLLAVPERGAHRCLLAVLPQLVAPYHHTMNGIWPVCETQGGSGLPATGQTKCYAINGNEIPCASDTCAGQNGLYATGCASEGRFVNNGNGTVTDNCTGLIWQKDSGNDGNPLRWCSALAYCENLDFGGHDDWRLPNVRELQSASHWVNNAKL